MSRIAVYPGTFDPFTNGHLGLIERASRIFDHLIVAIAVSARKSPTYSLQQRIEMARRSLAVLDNVTVEACEGLLVDFVASRGSRIIVRGLRAVSDFDYEFQLSGMNHCLDSNIETVFLPALGESAFVSGTMVREIMRLGGDVSAFVPGAVLSFFSNQDNEGME